MAKLIVNEHKKIGTINPEIYGHFSEHLGRCIYEGIYVKEDSGIPNVNGMRTDVVEALKELRVPVLRWPGGCFADEYHWKDGIGDKDSRKKMINTHWGGVVEDNSFGTHEYFELCRQLGCKSYVNGNLGSGSVQEMSEWVEYMTFDGVSPMAELRKQNGHEAPFKVDYFGVGNENWGCGGNMRPTYYADAYRRYQTYVRSYDSTAPIYKICCGANAGDTNWTSEVLKTCYDGHQPWEKNFHGYMDGLSLHYYDTEWENKGSATQFTEEEYKKIIAGALHMEDLIRQHGAIMDQYDPGKRIGMIVDEWGTWFDVEPGTNPGFLYQQNTMRDALVAALTLNIFNQHCDRVKMACIAQMVNVLQSVILTDGPRMLKTPTYYIFHMFREHQGAEAIESHLAELEHIAYQEQEIPTLQQSVSIREDGSVLVTIANVSTTSEYPVELCATERSFSQATGRILTQKMDAYNTFDEPDLVKEEAFEKITLDGSKVLFTIPPCSVISLKLQ